MSVRRVAVVGAGRMGRLHARAVARRAQAVGDVELAWTIDRHAARSGDVAEAFGGRAGDALGALRGEVDLAVVSVTTAAHEDIARQLIEDGVDVLIEKPMATDAASARRLDALATAAGRILAVGHSEWFNARVVRAREAAARADRIEVVREAESSARGLDLDVVQDLMLHDLDWLAREEPTAPRIVEVSGMAAADGPGRPVDRAGDPAYTDEVEVELELARGRRARLRASRRAVRRRRDVTIERDGTRETIDLLAPDPAEREPLDDAWADFVTACQTRRRPINDATVAVAVLELIESIQRALRQDPSC